VKEEKVDFNNMTKDELNDYAAKHFPEAEIKGYWNKKKILKEVKKLAGE